MPRALSSLSDIHPMPYRVGRRCEVQRATANRWDLFAGAGLTPTPLTERVEPSSLRPGPDPIPARALFTTSARGRHVHESRLTGVRRDGIFVLSLGKKGEAG